MPSRIAGLSAPPHREAEVARATARCRAMPEIRTDRVEAARARLAAGSLGIPAERLADALLARGDFRRLISR